LEKGYSLVKLFSIYRCKISTHSRLGTGMWIAAGIALKKKGRGARYRVGALGTAARLVKIYAFAGFCGAGENGDWFMVNLCCVPLPCSFSGSLVNNLLSYIYFQSPTSGSSTHYRSTLYTVVSAGTSQNCAARFGDSSTNSHVANQIGTLGCCAFVAIS
jgi:hypothetical protein